ncbi:MAG: hypothetical protein H0U03_13045 [Actinobacteria bacterium]|nr:hypothetical protein [Actinomycetota bacterium]
MKVRFCDEFDAGFGWIAAEPPLLQRCSHAVRSGGGVWLTDPVDGEGVEARIRALGEPAGVVQLLDRHKRDSVALASRLSVPHYEVPLDGVPGAPFQVVKVVGIPTWHEVALWFAEERALVCADALGTASYYLAPGEQLAVHPLLRLLPPRRLGGRQPLHVLVGHGAGLHGEEAGAGLERALRDSRRTTPRWVAGAARRAARRLTQR